MYEINRRYMVSAIIPVLFGVMGIINILKKSSMLSAYKLNINVPLEIGLVVLSMFIAWVLATLFLSLETIFKTYITEKDSEDYKALAMRIKQSSLRQKLNEIFRFDTIPQPKKITQSVIFQSGITLIMIYTFTSSDSLLGRALLSSIAIQLLIEQALTLSANRSLSSWFWQLKTDFDETSQKTYFAMTAVISIICLIMMF